MDEKGGPAEADLDLPQQRGVVARERPLRKEPRGLQPGRPAAGMAKELLLAMFTRLYNAAGAALLGAVRRATTAELPARAAGVPALAPNAR